MTVNCPKCANRGQDGDRWHATGGRNTNRYGTRRAELVCEICRYQWSSGLPAALEAAALVSGPDEWQPPTIPPQPAVALSEKDWKKKQAGDA